MLRYLTFFLLYILALFQDRILKGNPQRTLYADHISAYGAIVFIYSTYPVAQYLCYTIRHRTDIRNDILRCENGCV